MTLAPGTPLGPYEIVAPIGAGGMGEVYRARDTRLQRDVAIKVIADAVAADPDRIARFERESRAVAALSHPNILAIHDVGRDHGREYAVIELLRGKTLRELLLDGPLPLRKAVNYAVQIARGLAAAHEQGITHRDLKPENVFVTTDGVVKILDFGLARVTTLKPDRLSVTRTQTTEPGTVMGTVGYMAPEQVRGEEVDHRSDIFAFGAVLYELVSGSRAFAGTTAVDTMHAILNGDAADLPPRVAATMPALEGLIRHCLEKDPAHRFQSARDLAFALDAVAVPTASSASVAATAGRRIHWRPVAAVAALLAAAAGGYFLRHDARGSGEPPTYQELTFQRGSVVNARFAPDGQTVVYSAAWAESPFEIFAARINNAESRSLGLPPSGLLAMSANGEMLILLGMSGAARPTGTLARVSLGGGSPRELAADVNAADWGADGERVALARQSGGMAVIEMPPGKVVYRANGFVSHLRLHRDGVRLAFIDHPIANDTAGNVRVIDGNGAVRTLSDGWTNIAGIAWASNDEIWFTGTRRGSVQGLYAVTTAGTERLVAQAPGSITLQDINGDGRVLITRDEWRQEMRGKAPGAPRERDLSWLDLSSSMDLSADGQTVLFTESGEGGGPDYGVYVRSTDGAPAIRLGPGGALALSPDKQWVLATRGGTTLDVLPVSVGQSRTLPRGTVEHYHPMARWMPDGRVLFAANEAGHGIRLFVQDLAGGDPHPVTDEIVIVDANVVISPDGTQTIARDTQGHWQMFPIAGGPSHQIPELGPDDIVIRYTADGRGLLLYRFNEVPGHVTRFDFATRRKTPMIDLAPPDTTGVSAGAIGPVIWSADGNAYVYSYARVLSELFLVQGLR